MLFMAACAFGQGINFEEAPFSQLLDKAKKENKLIFLDAYASWCGPCKLMAKNVFPLESVGKHYNSKFINTKIDMEKGEGVELAKKYEVKAYPTYLFINGDGKVVHRVLGYVPENEFIQFAKDAEDPNRNLFALIDRYKAGEKEPEFLKNLAMLTVYSDPQLSSEVVAKYFDEKKDAAFDNIDVQLLISGIKDTSSPSYKIFKEKKDVIIKAGITEEQYDNIDTSIKTKEVFVKNTNKETGAVDEAKLAVDLNNLLGKEKGERALKSYLANKAYKEKDYAKYAKLTMENNKEYIQLPAPVLNSLAWNFFEKVEDKNALKTAILWAQESVKKSEGYANTDTLANLYLKVGDKKNAKIWATKSIELGKAAGEDVTETENLLKKIK